MRKAVRNSLLLGAWATLTGAALFPLFRNNPRLAPLYSPQEESPYSLIDPIERLPPMRTDFLEDIADEEFFQDLQQDEEFAYSIWEGEETGVSAPSRENFIKTFDADINGRDYGAKGGIRNIVVADFFRHADLDAYPLVEERFRWLSPDDSQNKIGDLIALPRAVELEESWEDVKSLYMEGKQYSILSSYAGQLPFTSPEHSAEKFSQLGQFLGDDSLSDRILEYSELVRDLREENLYSSIDEMSEKQKAMAFEIADQIASVATPLYREKMEQLELSLPRGPLRQQLSDVFWAYNRSLELTKLSGGKK